MRHVLLLRGINLGSRHRVPMAQLRELLSAAGYDDVETYVQSGNVVLSSPVKAAELERATERLISEEFGFEVPVLARSQRQLAAVVRRDPHGEAADNHKRYQVSFLSAPVSAEVRRRLQELAQTDRGERFACHGRELYAYHPEGVAQSRLWTTLAGPKLGVTATARNWTTVTTLLEMARGS